MNNNIVFIHDDLFTHPAATLFSASIKACSRGSMGLEFTVRDKALSNFCDSAGVCNLLVDYAARKVGFESMGCCFVSEFEMSICHRHLAQTLFLDISLESCTGSDASYLCQIYVQTPARQVLIAESQGTLLKQP